MSIKRLRKAGEILTIWLFWLTFEKVADGFQYHHGEARDLYGISIAFLIRSLDRSLSARLIPAYGFGVYGFPYSPTVLLLYKVELKQGAYKVTKWVFGSYVAIKIVRRIEAVEKDKVRNAEDKVYDAVGKAAKTAYRAYIDATSQPLSMSRP